MSDKLLQRPLKMFLFGDPGTGKTRLAASAHLIEEMRPVLLADIDGGTISLFRPGLEGIYDDLEIRDLWRPGHNSNRMLAALEELYEEVTADDAPWKTVIIDTLSEVNRVGMHFISEQPRGFKGVLRPIKVTIPMYGASLQQTTVLVRLFCAEEVGLNVIMTADVRRATHETDGHDYIVPGLIGQQWKSVLAAFDEVCYLYTKPAVSLEDPAKGVAYRAIFQPWDTLKTKNRYLEVPVSMDLTNKTLEDILTCQS